MIGYDATLGWSLNPGWRGRHRHHDFDVSYSIDQYGMRRDTPGIGAADPRPVTFVVGDSFTFGLGVNDADTFVHRLAAGQAGGPRFVNASIPGYSTDQQVLLIEQRLLALRPAGILLVVYVGNDLLDNPRSVPLQVRSPKPFFELADGQLLLRNNPVPSGRTESVAGFGGLLGAVLGNDPARWPLRTRVVTQSELLQLIADPLWPDADISGSFPTRFASSVDLFDALLARLNETCSRGRVRLTVAVLAGRSFFVSPRSISAQYQDYFREEVLRAARKHGVVPIDIAAALRSRNSGSTASWFHPNDGHLTAAGHSAVASVLSEHLKQ
jgi:hypothetical protein